MHKKRLYMALYNFESPKLPKALVPSDVVVELTVNQSGAEYY